jgi:hypothetical protein
MLTDIFRPFPREARSETLAAYKTFLAARDGAMDLEKRQLSRREEGMARYEQSPSRIRDIDRDLFARQYEAFDPKARTAPELMLLLALVKVNAAEAYGVNRNYELQLRRAVKKGDDLELMLLCEETYHTRILLSSARCYGIEVKAAYTPPTALRVLIGAIGGTPQVVSRPLIMAAEVMGVLSFLNLLEKTRTILRHDPELRDGIEERLCEVLVDEIGHVSFNRALLGSAGLAQARMLLPVLGATMSSVIPELKALGTMPSGSQDEVTSLAKASRLPAQVARAAFVC